MKTFMSQISSVAFAIHKMDLTFRTMYIFYFHTGRLLYLCFHGMALGLPHLYYLILLGVYFR